MIDGAHANLHEVVHEVVSGMEQLYGIENISFNVPTCIHCSIWQRPCVSAVYSGHAPCSVFTFEGFNRTILKFCYDGTKHMAQQIVDNFE